jgi:hypothetical protein
MVSDLDGILEKLGVAHYVSGWGTKLETNAYKALGDKFTLAQAEAYARPILEAKAKAKYDAAIAKQNKKADAFSEAARTGQKVILKQWSEDCNDPSEECDIDNIIQYAMPDGTTKTIRSHSR